MLQNNRFFSVAFPQSRLFAGITGKAFPVIAIPLCAGILIGTLIGMFSTIPDAFSSVLGFLQDKSSDQNLLYAAAHSLRFVLSVLFLAFTLYGVVLIPAISMLRGFLLGCSVAAMFQAGSFRGLLLAALSIGIPAALGIPAFLLASMDSFRISSSLVKPFFKNQWGSMEQKTALASHLMILIFLIAAEVFYSSYLLPALLRTI